MSRPRAFSRRSPDSVIEPSGNASAAATAKRNGVVAVTRSAVRLNAVLRRWSRDELIRYRIEAHGGEWECRQRMIAVHRER